jgi:hypothetical protein
MSRFCAARLPHSLSSAAIAVRTFLIILGLIGAAGSALALLTPAKKPSYVGCYTDFEPFVLAVGADLRRYRGLVGLPDRAEYAAMLKAAEAMHRKAAVPATPGSSVVAGWVFEPGGYTDYPDFQWANWNGKGAMPKSAPDPRVAWDSSHFTRWPLWLESYEAAADTAAQRAYFRDLRRGLANQFAQKVLVPPSAEFRTYRLANFMDGRNGVFRGNNGPNRYLPYQMSGTFVLGWWRFLDDDRITNAYRHVAKAFPMSQAERTVFFGPLDRFDDPYAAHLTRLAGLRKGEPVQRRDRNLFAVFEAPRLAQPLWASVDAQAGLHDLTLPMRVGFERGVGPWQEAYGAHFARFVAARKSRPRLLDELHYLNFASQFMVQAALADREDLIPDGLPEAVERRLLTLWKDAGTVISHTGWGEEAFTGFKPYLEWKLKQPCPYPK